MNEANLVQIPKWVQTQVGPSRFLHIQGVVKIAGLLAQRHRLPKTKALLAAWLHDCGKELTRGQMGSWLKNSRFKLDQGEKQMPGLWHPHVAAEIALKKWKIRDGEVLEAIRCHTLGKAGMKPLAKLIFVSDFIENGRRFEGVELVRKKAWKSLNAAALKKVELTVSFLFQKNMTIHPRLLETWNHLLRRGTDEKI